MHSTSRTRCPARPGSGAETLTGPRTFARRARRRTPACARRGSESRVAVGGVPRAQVRERAQAVDAGVGPEVDRRPCRAGPGQRRRVEPAREAPSPGAGRSRRGRRGGDTLVGTSVPRGARRAPAAAPPPSMRSWSARCSRARGLEALVDIEGERESMRPRARRATRRSVRPGPETPAASRPPSAIASIGTAAPSA